MKLIISNKELRIIYSIFIVFIIINNQVICFQEEKKNNKLNLLKNLLSNLKNNNSELRKFLNKK